MTAPGRTLDGDAASAGVDRVGPVVVAAASPASRWGRCGIAVLLAIAAATVIVVSALPEARGYLAVLTALGVLLLGVGASWRFSSLVAAGVLFLGLAFVLGHVDRDGVPGLVVVVTPMLFGAAELAHWSMDLATPVHDEPGVHLSRWIWLVGSIGATVLLSAALVGAARVRLEADLPLASLAVVAVIGLLGLTVALARRDGPV